MAFELKKLKLDLKVNWKISRNESLFKENFILSDEGYESEVAPNIRYGETPERIETEFQELLKLKVEQPHWCNSFKNAYRNVELKKKSKNQIHQYFGLNSVKEVMTSYSIPMMDLDDIGEYLEANNQYEIYKLKIANLSDIILLEEVSQNTDKKIRIDANEGFLSLKNYREFEKKISNYNIDFIEQPFPSAHKDDYKELRKNSLYEIIADESVEADFHPEELAEMFHGVNIKLMKAGGIERSKELLEKARNQGLKTMLGCMIETSLGISEALYLAELVDYFDLDGSLLIKNDPYKHLLEFKGSSVSFK